VTITKRDPTAADWEKVERDDAFVAGTFKELLGHSMSSVQQVRDAELVFTRRDGRAFKFHYEPDCCATCYIEDVCGDLADLVGSPLVEAVHVSNYTREAPPNADSYTWTFYRFSTVKGTVTVRWLGESNGYYSESVSFDEVVL
jgi:hypothetical protein